MEDYLKTYTLFRKIDRISDLVNLCPMENEAAFVTLQNFGREAYGMYWSTEDMLTRDEIPLFAVMHKCTIPRIGSENGRDVLAMSWYVNVNETLIVKVCAIEDEVLDRIAEL